MILLPRGVNQRVMESYLPFMTLVRVYLALFAGGTTPENAQALPDLIEM